MLQPSPSRSSYTSTLHPDRRLHLSLDTSNTLLLPMLFPSLFLLSGRFLLPSTIHHIHLQNPTLPLKHSSSLSFPRRHFIEPPCSKYSFTPHLYQYFHLYHLPPSPVLYCVFICLSPSHHLELLGVRILPQCLVPCPVQ